MYFHILFSEIPPFVGRFQWLWFGSLMSAPEVSGMNLTLPRENACLILQSSFYETIFCFIKPEQK